MRDLDRVQFYNGSPYKNNGDAKVAFDFDPKIKSDVMKEMKKYYTYFTMPDDFDWKYVPDSSVWTGTIRDRFRKLTGADRWNYVRYSVRRLIERQEGLWKDMERYNGIFDWTFKIDWRSGEFGDRNSCYFPPGGYVSAMHRNGVGAIRKYSVNCDGIASKGVARAWMAVDQPVNGMICIYNAYGSARCSEFAEVLAEILGNKLNLGTFRWDDRKISVVGKKHFNGDSSVVFNAKTVPAIYSDRHSKPTVDCSLGDL